MNKNGKKVAVILLLAVVAVGSYFVSGTYARYSRALTGTDTATVAKFSVSANGLDKDGTATFDLFNTTLKEDSDLSTDEDNVLNTKIAPGTGGFFETTLTNDSEVDVTAVLKLKETSNTSGVPIEYSIDKTAWNQVDSTSKEVVLKTVDLDYVGKGDSPKVTDKVTVYWRWAFEKNTEAADTTIGETQPAPTVETTITATFTQKS